MPDEMLDDAIACSEHAFRENKGNIEANGNLVSGTHDRIDSGADQEAYG